MSRQPDRLTGEELAQRAGTSVERIREFAALGILEPADGTFPRRDVMRARVVLELEAKGIEHHLVAEAMASGHLTLGYVESAVRRLPRLDQTYGQVSEEMGMPLETLQRFYVAFGL